MDGGVRGGGGEHGGRRGNAETVGKSFNGSKSPTAAAHACVR